MPRSLHAPSIASGILLIVVGIVLVVPALMVLVTVIAGAANRGILWQDLVPDVRLLGLTLGTAILIALLATAIAWPAAWSARTWPWQYLIILLMPMLLPSYLAYSGWGMLRAPGTWLGNLLLRGPAGAGATENWWPLAASRIQAIIGLTLWAWPLAAAVLVARFRTLDANTLEALRLEPVGPLRRISVILGLMRSGVLAAVGLVTLIMLGSAVPLHVAQFETYAIFIWRRMTETPHAEQWRIWIAAWPLLLIALVAAIGITRRISAIDQLALPRSLRSASPRPAAAMLFPAAIWLLSILVPAILFMTSLRGTQPLVRFWYRSWQPLLGSSTIAAGTALIALILICCAWLATSAGGWPRRIALATGAALLAAGLAPGILVGAAMARAWSLVGGHFALAREVADSPVILVLAHLGRFGFLAVLAGIALAGVEPRNLRDLRFLDAGPSLRGFLRCALPPQLGTVLAISLAVGLLSFHEIEAAVLLQPPSAVGGNLPWQMLQWLHFARMDDLSAAVLWVLAIAAAGLALLTGAAWLGQRSRHGG